jgi:hypothetical protein
MISVSFSLFRYTLIKKKYACTYHFKREFTFFSDLEFVTPASSLGSPAVTSDTDEADIKPKVKIDDEGEFRKRIYETYSIQLSDMQVIVGRLKDNWRHAQIKGKLVVHLHILELVKLKMHVKKLKIG